MAYSEHLDDFPQCASVPHAILNIQIVYCTHDSGYTMSCYMGDQTGSMWTDHVYRYGPFDDIHDLAADVSKWLAVVARRRLLKASLVIHAEDGQHGEEPTEP